MPTYLYECPNCGEFEDVHNMSDHQSEWPCPVCNAWSRQLINFGGAIKGDESPWWIVGKNYSRGVRKPDRLERDKGAFETLRAPGILTHPSQIDTRSKYKKYLRDHDLHEAG